MIYARRSARIAASSDSGASRTNQCCDQGPDTLSASGPFVRPALPTIDTRIGVFIVTRCWWRYLALAASLLNAFVMHVIGGAMSEQRTANLLGALALAVSNQLIDTVVETVGAGASAPAALITLLTEPGVGVTQLGVRIGLSQPAAARLVTGLVDQALVERRVGRDGRGVALYVTEQGRKRAQEAIAARQRTVSALVSALDVDEQKILTGALEKLLVSLLDKDGRPFVLCRLCDRASCIADDGICPVGVAARARGIEAG